MDSLIQSLVSSFQNKMPGELVVFIISLFPVIELRGGLIAASLLGIEWWKAFIFCFAGNMLPIPFILLFIRKIFDWLRKWAPFEKIVSAMERKAEKNKAKVDKYRLWGLFILVAVPLPGTGAWTGALVAAFTEIRLKHSIPVIAAGVIVAGIVVGFISYGVAGLVG